MEDLNCLKIVLAETKKTNKWCTNTSQPDLQTLNQIANLLNINLKDLIVDNK